MRPPPPSPALRDAEKRACGRPLRQPSHAGDKVIKHSAVSQIGESGERALGQKCRPAAACSGRNACWPHKSPRCPAPHDLAAPPASDPASARCLDPPRASAWKRLAEPRHRSPCLASRLRAHPAIAPPANDPSTSPATCHSRKPRSTLPVRLRHLFPQRSLPPEPSRER